MATNALFRFGGITQPFIFLGLSSFFLKFLQPSHRIYFPHILAQPSCQQEVSKTIWHILQEVRCSKVESVFASTSPSIFFTYMLELCLRSIAASIPSSINRFLNRSMVRIPILRILLICSFVALSENAPSSQFNKT